MARIYDPVTPYKDLHIPKGTGPLAKAKAYTCSVVTLPDGCRYQNP